MTSPTRRGALARLTLAKQAPQLARRGSQCALVLADAVVLALQKHAAHKL